MRLLTIVLLVAAVTASFVATLTHDGQVAVAAQLVYGLAFVASIIAFARGLPRTPEDPPQAPTAHLSRSSASAHS